MAEIDRESVAIGRRLEALREARKLPRSWMAFRLAMSVENWRHYETGRNRMPIQMVFGVASALSMTFEELAAELHAAFREARAGEPPSWDGGDVRDPKAVGVRSGRPLGRVLIPA